MNRVEVGWEWAELKTRAARGLWATEPLQLRDGLDHVGHFLPVVFLIQHFQSVLILTK